MRNANLKTLFAISIIRPAIISAIILFLLLPARSAFAGSILGWGRNIEGQATPPLGNNYIAISAGAFYSLGLKNDGSIVALGSNYDESGDYTGQCNIPSPNSGFIAIASGGSHNLGLKQDGSIVEWSSITGVPSPNADFIAIAASGVHSLGLKRNGCIVNW